MVATALYGVHPLAPFGFASLVAIVSLAALSSLPMPENALSARPSALVPVRRDYPTYGGQGEDDPFLERGDVFEARPPPNAREPPRGGLGVSFP